MVSMNGRRVITAETMSIYIWTSECCIEICFKKRKPRPHCHAFCAVSPSWWLMEAHSGVYKEIVNSLFVWTELVCRQCINCGYMLIFLTSLLILYGKSTTQWSKGGLGIELYWDLQSIIVYTTVSSIKPLVAQEEAACYSLNCIKGMSLSC